MKPYCNVLSFRDILGQALSAALNNELYKCISTTTEDDKPVQVLKLAVSKSKLFKFIDDRLWNIVDKRRREGHYRKTIIIFTCNTANNVHFKHSRQTDIPNAYYILDMDGFTLSVSDITAITEHFIKSATKLFKDKHNIKIAYPTLCFETMLTVVKTAYNTVITIDSYPSILFDANIMIEKSANMQTDGHITNFIVEQLGLQLGE